MTPEQILQDIKSDRVKKVIMDGDYCAEIDDQYTLAYALGCDKLEVLGATAVAYYDEPDAMDTEAVMLKSYAEIIRVYEALDISPDELPALKGACSRITVNPDFGPSDSPAARFIIEMAHKYDETIYVITTGPCTNAVSACLLDPTIMDKICVVWLGGNCIEENNEPFHEWNLYSDYAASQILLTLPIPLIMCPCDPCGSILIDMTKEDLDALDGDNKAAHFLKTDLPMTIYTEEKLNAPDWHKIMCDYMGVAALSVPEAMEFSIIPSPCMGDDHKYTIDSTRRKMIYAVNPDSRMIIDDSIKALNRVIAERN